MYRGRLVFGVTLKKKSQERPRVRATQSRVFSVIFHQENLLVTEDWSSHRYLRANPRGSLSLFVYQPCTGRDCYWKLRGGKIVVWSSVAVEDRNTVTHTVKPVLRQAPSNLLERILCFFCGATKQTSAQTQSCGNQVEMVLQSCNFFNCVF